MSKISPISITSILHKIISKKGSIKRLKIYPVDISKEERISRFTSTSTLIIKKILKFDVKWVYPDNNKLYKCKLKIVEDQRIKQQKKENKKILSIVLSFQLANTGTQEKVTQREYLRVGLRLKKVLSQGNNFPSIDVQVKSLSLTRVRILTSFDPPILDFNLLREWLDHMINNLLSFDFELKSLPTDPIHIKR